LHDRKLSKDARISEYSPEQTYLSVGLALSYWEASEDVLMGLFNWLCQEEHVAMKAYLRSPRTVRSKFIKDALDRYNRRISDDEKSTILKSMKELDKLAQRRNQIAHGHVSDVSRSVENEEVMKGVFLMPALSESGLPALREPRYSLTSGEIDEFREEVRDHRWAIHTAHAAAMVREQNSY
jgi:hypothetical protein